MKVFRWDITVWWKQFSDLVPTGILGGDGLPGVVPVLVVNSLLVPSVLSVQSHWPDTDNSSSIWRPSEVKIARFDVSWQRPAFCCLCVWKHRPCLEELPSVLVGVRWGRRVSSSYDFPVLLAVLPFSFWSHHQIFPGFYEWRLPESSLGNGWLKKTFQKMRPSKPSPLIKPYFQWERRKKAKE